MICVRNQYSALTTNIDLLYKRLNISETESERLREELNKFLLQMDAKIEDLRKGLTSGD